MKKLIGIMLTLLMSLGFVFCMACGQNGGTGGGTADDPYAHIPAEYRFKLPVEEYEPDRVCGDTSTGEACAYRSSKTEFDKNDVTLSFYFGTYFVYDDAQTQLERSPFRDYPFLDLYCKAYKPVGTLFEQTGEHFIKRNNGRYISEHYNKYKAIFVCNSHWQLTEIIFNTKEVIKIPAELFTESEGFISFQIRAPHLLDENNIQTFNSVIINYRLEEDKVIIQDDMKIQY